MQVCRRDRALNLSVKSLALRLLSAPMGAMLLSVACSNSSPAGGGDGSTGDASTDGSESCSGAVQDGTCSKEGLVCAGACNQCACDKGHWSCTSFGCVDAGSSVDSSGSADAHAGLDAGALESSTETGAAGDAKSE